MRTFVDEEATIFRSRVRSPRKVPHTPFSDGVPAQCAPFGSQVKSSQHSIGFRMRYVDMT